MEWTMSDTGADLPRDVVYASITRDEAELLKAQYIEGAAADGVNVEFAEDPKVGEPVRLSVHFSHHAPAPHAPEPAEAVAPAVPAALPPVADDTPAIPRQIAWGQLVEPAFKQSLLAMCGRLQVDPNFMMACMAFETGQSFSPSKANSISGATGLIQFMPSTAISLRTTTAELAQMTAVQQLDFVERYFNPHAGKLKTLSDVYMAILFPRAIGQLESFVLFALPTQAYVQNRGLDSNNDGQVTKAEAAAKVQQALITGMAKANLG
jgi:hypothetical protein